MKRRKTLSARAAAAKTLRAVAEEGRSLSAAMAPALEQVEENDRSFLQALCYGACRHYLTLEHWLGLLLRQPIKAKERDIHFLLLSGLHQLAFMDKPAHVSINETVNVTKELNKLWATKLVNGVLRSFQRRKDELLAHIDADPSLRYAMPRWLLDKLAADYPQQLDELLAASNAQAPLTLRVNLQKVQREDYLQQLRQAEVEAHLCEWVETGIQCEQAVDVNCLPGFFDAGLCSVQDEAAQLSAALMDPQPNERVLDACCAPGGKTAALLERCPDISVTAVDVDPERQLRTRDTLQRLQLNADVRTADVGDLQQWWDGTPFDRILLDAPCSATGVIRRHPDIKLLRRSEDIPQLAELQLKLLRTLWTTLKPGGLLVYATCSILKEENGHIIERFIADATDAEVLPIEGKYGIQSSFGVQLLPVTGGHDGFFYARLRKQPTPKVSAVDA
ncbi:16S rRNA (cytosine(967)-C(5))-methyltransferase RsmB [Hahella aquimaris]|uniref:16S rRNA (cytosine(967)-C(5))-methyltransferase RsmB n=1 Tax=Hahella sp. HNIBRBA332 TaxID=3015983 RepID=UPI00273BDC10|nr:16S rRNA (cytosine(967)-C(5))-methyltransferase RsmB [Hahella sp. HNIBRBA332]WLQ13033.1 16S rRNA (cytosine(967)-C(5))-methyltransferase RsmB [Hahella sp. HNIBRBA332]